jgi:hypothetical protein
MKGCLLTAALVALAVLFAACSVSTNGSKDGGVDAGTATDAESDSGIDSGTGGGDISDDAGDGGGTDAAFDGGKAAYAPDPQRIYDDIALLASDEYEGRFPGTTGNDLAVELVRSRFEKLGITKAVKGTSFLQPFKFKQWFQDGQSTFKIGATTLTEGVDFITMSNSNSVNVTGELVFVGYGATVPAFSKTEYPNCPFDAAGYDDYKGIDVTDKIVIVLRRIPADNEAFYTCPVNPEAFTDPDSTIARFDYKAKNAKFHGAKAMILVPNLASGPEYPDKVGLPGMDDTFAPALFANRDRIKDGVANLQTWAAQIDSTLKPDSHLTGVQATVEIKATVQITQSTNVIGTIPGTDPILKDEIILIGAHLDHLGTDVFGNVYYGADDNASGTAVMMELARAAVESGLKPARTLVFAGWNAEEEGLLGSCYYVMYDPLFPINKVKAAFSVDMVGAGNGTGLYIFGATDFDKAWIADLIAEAAYRKGLEFGVEKTQPSGASDHACFAQEGVAAVMAFALTDADHLYYHTLDDKIDTLSMTTLKAAIELMWAGLEPMALGTEKDYLTIKSYARIAEPSKVRPLLLKLDKNM